MHLFKPRLSLLPVRFDGLPGGAYQTLMRSAFIEQANIMLNKYRPRDTKAFQIGMEMEYSVVINNGTFGLAGESVRNAAITNFSDSESGEATFVSMELGGSQIEINTDAIDVNEESGLALLEEMRKREKDLNEYLLTQGAMLLRMGCYPLIRIADILRSTQTKYTLCPQFHNENRRPMMNYFIGNDSSIDVRDAAIPAITNAAQLNFDCASFDEAVEMQNRTIVHSPFITALGANAGMIDQADSGYADLRYIAWEISHDIRSWSEVMNQVDTRIGIPYRYYTSIEDYLESVLRHPFFMENMEKKEAPFQMGVGVYWRDSRIKFLEKSDHIQLVVELRPLSTQPTVEGDFSLLMLHLGRAHYDRVSNIDLLPIRYVRANKEIAMRLGRHGKYVQMNRQGQIAEMTFDEMFDFEVAAGMQGLQSIGIDTKTIMFIERYIHDHYRSEAPVDSFRRVVQNELKSSPDMTSAMVSAIKTLNLTVK